MNSYSKININIPLVSSSYFNFYLNNVRVFLGSDFYLDYSTSNNCFIYYNLANIKCLKAKKGYAIYKEAVTLPESCYQYGSFFEAVVYNKYTMECIKINSIILGC